MLIGGEKRGEVPRGNSPLEGSSPSDSITSRSKSDLSPLPTLHCVGTNMEDI